MWVVDASAAAELLLGTAQGRTAAATIGDEDIYAPQLLAAEVLSVMRGMVRGGHITPARAEAALRDLDDLGIIWVDMPPLVGAAWALRDSASAYDAMYVALAERLGCMLLTCDRRLAKAFTCCVMPQG